jgi:serine/threonine-protein kinase
MSTAKEELSATVASPHTRPDSVPVAVAPTIDSGKITTGTSAASSATLGRTAGGRTTVLPPRPDAPPAPVGERYEAVRSLGAGGMGEVALVRDHDIGRTVAVKRPLGALDGEGLYRFAREVRTIGRLEHPGIVPIHDVGVDTDGRHYFVMKYVEGETLGDIIKKLAAGDAEYLRRWTHEARTQLFMQLLQTVRYAHAQGILHRDIKPDNIMVGPYGEVILMDWGIARELGAAADSPGGTSAGARAGEPRSAGETTEGALLGTPLYMSPEQARGENGTLDPRSDLYSLCAVFYELMTLHHYLGEPRSAAATLASIITDPEPTGAQWLAIGGRYQVPPELVHFLRRGMHKDREARYQSVDEMLEVLGAVRDHRPLVQCHLTFMKRGIGALEHALDRYPALMTAVSMLLVLGLLAGAWAGVAAILHR